MQAFASPVKKGTNYPTEKQEVMGKKRHTPLQENCWG
jgi:hypothetical protein